MPVTSPPEKVLVTDELASYCFSPSFGRVHRRLAGASGFIGAWVVRTFLEHGFAVRGTVRSHSKGIYLQKMFDASHPGLFEYTIVQDISAPGAFDDAVRGVSGIAHTASPVAHADDPKDLIKPAVQGTLEILRSATMCGNAIKRIVVTASMASVMEPHPMPYTYSERDWNETSVKEVETNGKNAADIDKYRASKTLAEKALWNFFKEESVPFDAVTIQPPFVFGPIIHECTSLEQLNESIKGLYDLFTKGVPDSHLGNYLGNHIDVRDCAQMHIDALTREDLAGRRLIVGVRPLAPQDLFDAANSLQEGTLSALPYKIPVGKPGLGDEVRHTFHQYSPESAQLLGIRLRGTAEIVRDTLMSLHERGLDVVRT